MKKLFSTLTIFFISCLWAFVGSISSPLGRSGGASLYSQAFPNPATLSTGQGAPGSLDPLWVVSPWYSSSPPNPIGLSYNPALINNNCAPGAWVNPAALPPPVNNGNWITGSDAPCAGNTNAGYRYFRLTINLPADCNGNSVTVAGNYVLYLSGYADNTISDVFINGNSTGISGGNFSSGGQLNMTLVGPWVVGINFVDVLMYNFPNGGGGNPYGLLLVANSTASSANDGDGDGVFDLNDQCPCQPGSLANGCPASIVGDTIICEGENTTLTSTGVGTYLWNTGSTNASITISPAFTTSYSVIVTTSSGFMDSATINITVNLLPSVSITGDTIICSGESISLTATGGGTYVWNTGSTNTAITETPTATTNYKVIVTNSDGCKDSINQSVTVFPKPNANFTFSNQCNGTAIPFNSTSTINNPSIISSLSWDFGDSTISFDSTTSHIFSNPGNYTVTLLVNSNSSCSDTIIQVVTVFNNPVAGFTHNDVCLGDTMRFTNTSIVNLPASISNYLWVFGDNSPTGNLENPNHYYVNAGAYNVTLIVTTADGCSDTISIAVNTFDAPISGFTFNNVCLFDSAMFTNSSLNPATGSIASWSWNFGNSTPLNTTVWSPYHLYASPGDYLITLITHSTNLGCADTLKDSITVFPMPVANFGFMNVCLNQPMNFNDSSTVSSGTIANWSWNFGDGSPLVIIQHPNRTYTNQGAYIVSLIVTTNNGCKDTITKSVVVHPLPAALYSAANVCLGSIANFTNFSTIPNNPTNDVIESWTWNFGNGSPIVNTQNSSHLYATNGSYFVELLVVSNFGCTDSITKISIIHPNPFVNFTASDTVGCEPLCITFQDASSIASGNNAQLQWNFADGSSTSNSPEPLHCYINDSVFSPISFSPTLKVTSDSGCVSTTSKNNYITVYPNPDAGFTVQPETTTITDPIITITDLSKGTDYWNWNFGDFTTSTIYNPPSHTYSDTGSYLITLITSTAYGCIDTSYQTIIIEPDFVFYIPNAFTPDGDEINDTFCGKGIFINEYEMTIFNRWGNLLYKTSDINKPWDGKANHGKEIAQPDVYVYVIKVIDFKNKKHSYKGVVTLVR